MALDKVKQGVIADDAVGSSQIAPDTVVAADIGANAITASELADNAVDTAAIASNAVTTAKITDANITSAKLNTDVTDGSAITTEVKPHIIPGVLYPAYDDKKLDGTALAASTTGPASSTVASSKYGTVQSDGRMYYYTDIKGSKPIKDPRIGAHFGSQRHKFKSLQLLEQETATEGENVYSVDGREWMRAKGDKWVALYNINGNFIENSDASITTDDHFIEIVGYFNDANLLHWLSGTANDIFGVAVNGGTRQSNDFAISVSTPLNNRGVDPASLLNLTFNATPTLGINTLRISNTSGAYLSAYGIELIAQDTSNRNNIQIPSQNVVSHGKKFTVSGTPHYNPFNNQTIGDNTSHGKNTTGWTTYDSTLDTTTSLGLDAWVDSGNYYRPVNGGRVVKWVDSSGNIKTSVNMMPPSAKAIGSHSGNSGPHETAWTSTYQPVFSSGSIDHSLSEVAKTFHAREFGNGNANGGEGGTYKDASMLYATQRDITYVMDDGLSSFTASGVKGDSNIWRSGGTATYHYHTFIGTGISLKLHWGGTNTDIVEIAKNLPYGTHILKHDANDSDSNTMDFTLDGVSLKTGHGLGNTPSYGEITYFQPKRPPIPEDCVVLADYMLMADFVPQSTAGTEHIPKGVRFVAQSRDYKIDYTAGSNITDPFKPANLGFRTGQYFWYKTSNASGDTYTQELPFFGDSFVCHFTTQNDSDYEDPVVTLNGSALSGFTNTYNGSGVQAVSSAGVIDETGSAANDNVVNFKAGAGTLGSNTLKVSITTNEANKYVYNRSFSVATPIHTSHHYQSFETPFLHELVGGDRNMEQTNLVCTPDGKTWDQLTRDTSYISALKVNCNETDSITYSTTVVFTDWRGTAGEPGASRNFGNKDFAIAYDRMICLVEGKYEISMTTASNDDSATNYLLIKINGSEALTLRVRYQKSSYSGTTYVDLKRGDTIQVLGEWGGYGNHEYENFSIVRV